MKDFFIKIKKKYLAKGKIKYFFKKLLVFLFNPRFLLCFGIAWFITNGWCYAGIFLGTYFKITWLLAASAAWATMLWIPFTPEKIVTVIIAIFLLRFLFPEDKKTLAVLLNLKEKYKIKKADKKGVKNEENS